MTFIDLPATRSHEEVDGSILIPQPSQPSASAQDGAALTTPTSVTVTGMPLPGAHYRPWSKMRAPFGPIRLANKQVTLRYVGRRGTMRYGWLQGTGKVKLGQCMVCQGTGEMSFGSRQSDLNRFA